MDDMRIWTDPRNHRAWEVKTYWGSGGQAMGVGLEVDISKIPAPPEIRRIEFIPADGQGPPYRTGMGEDEREAEEFSYKELEVLLNRARGER